MATLCFEKRCNANIPRMSYHKRRQARANHFCKRRDMFARDVSGACVCVRARMRACVCVRAARGLL